MPRIVLADVAKRYGRGHDRPAVEHLDLELPDGSFTAILGPSGCGKTTTLRMIAGLEQPTAGSISVGGRVFSSAEAGVFVPPERRGLGLVFQSYALWPHLKVSENVEFGLRIQKMARPERRRRVEEVLELLHVGHLAQRIPAQLSGGEQQRVAIARALAPRPNLVLFDEPLSNLDAPLRLELSAELNRLHRELAMTAVLVTHDQAEAMAVATQLVVMREGRVEQTGSPTGVYGAPASVHVARFLGSPPMNLVGVEGALAGLRDLAIASLRDGAVASLRGRDVPPGAVAQLVTQLGVRPEHVLIGPIGRTGSTGTVGSIGPGGPGGGSHPGWHVPARVESVLTTGPSSIVRLAVSGGHRLTAVVPGEAVLEPGEDVEASVEPERVHLFDAAGWRLGVGSGSGSGSGSLGALPAVETAAR